jgi:hypothetical protein
MISLLYALFASDKGEKQEEKRKSKIEHSDSHRGTTSLPQDNTFSAPEKTSTSLEREKPSEGKRPLEEKKDNLQKIVHHLPPTAKKRRKS